MKIFIYLFLLFSISCSFGQRLKFEYDAAGNQILRKYCSGGCTMKNTNPKEIAKLQPEDMQKFFPEDVISYYPNPVKDKFIMDFDSDPGEINYTITNTLGQVIHSGNKLVAHQEISMSPFPPGLYILKVQKESDRQVFKIVKE